MMLNLEEVTDFLCLECQYADNGRYGDASVHYTDWKCFCWCIFSETNLKVRQALTETSVMGDDIQQLSSFNGIRLFFVAEQFGLIKYVKILLNFIALHFRPSPKPSLYHYICCCHYHLVYGCLYLSYL